MTVCSKCNSQLHPLDTYCPVCSEPHAVDSSSEWKMRVALADTIVALDRAQKGLGKVDPNVERGLASLRLAFQAFADVER